MARMRQQEKPSCWAVLEAVAPHCSRVLLAGPPGTGKTVAAGRAGLRRSQRVYSITLTEDTPMAELRGHYIPTGRRFEWQDGPALAAWRDSARLVLNEIDRASGDVHTFCMALLDDPETAALTLPTGETVRPAPGFSVVATMNGEPGADLRPALRDRFPVVIAVDSIHPDALAALPEDLRNAAVGTTFVDEADRRVSVRVWVEFGRLRALVGEPVAARACFGRRAEELLTVLRVVRS
jgi:midasin (ATPase involved in ribosome maturation)